MKVLYIVASGSADPTRASIPLHLAANGSLEIGQEPVILLAGDGAEIILDDNTEKMEGIGLPPMRELIAKIKDNGVPVYV